MKFRPSLVAASAVYLAKWTLDQIEHPWVCLLYFVYSISITFMSYKFVLVFQLTKSVNFQLFLQNPTLEHYTKYMASDLKETVMALQDMQLNNAARLQAIRQKYRQTKVKFLSKTSL